MDTDVEAKKSFDGFLKHRAFSGFEDEVNISTGIMACEKDFPLFGEFLNYYDDASFYDSNGNITYVTNVEIITDICVKKVCYEIIRFKISKDLFFILKMFFVPSVIIP